MGFSDKLKGAVSSEQSRRFSLRPRLSNMTVLAIAALAGILMAILVWLIPVWRLESVTSATGLSEAIPAAAAPLGSTARAIFVIFSAILASSISLVALMAIRTTKKEDEYMNSSNIAERTNNRSRMPIFDDSMADNSDIAEKFKDQDDARLRQSLQRERTVNDEASSGKKFNIAAISGAAVAASEGLKSRISKLPFMGGDKSVKSFDDLPKLRNADSHPDAPARRPLSAHEDLGEKILDPISQVPEKIDNIDETEVYDDIQIDEDIQEKPIEPTADDLLDRHIHEMVGDDAYEDINEEYAKDNASHAVQPAVESDVETKILLESDAIDSVNDDNIENNDLPHKYFTAVPPSNEHREFVEADELPPLDVLMDKFESIIARQKANKANVSEESEDKADIHNSADIQNSKDQNSSEDNEQESSSNIGTDETPLPILVESVPSHEPVLKQVKPVDGQDGDIVVSKSQKAEMDSALKAALDTLHKMNQRSA